MKKAYIQIASLLVSILVLGSSAGSAFAQTYIHANGGTYWSQSGTGWNSINNDGYCVSGRGPCSSNLWYLQWNYDHSGCGLDAYATWTMAALLDYNGDTYAWIDSTAGNMYGADYTVYYNGGSQRHPAMDQSPYYEQWGTIALDTYRTGSVTLSDGWGNPYLCNGVSGLMVEFDEVKLEI